MLRKLRDAAELVQLLLASAEDEGVTTRGALEALVGETPGTHSVVQSVHPVATW